MLSIDEKKYLKKLLFTFKARRIVTKDNPPNCLLSGFN